MANFADLFLRHTFATLRQRSLLVCLCLAPLFFIGCSSAKVANQRPFNFPADTFAYANELKWEYSFDEQGDWSAKKREPAPDYTLHCFVVARSAKQFFQNARFTPEAPPLDETGTRKVIRKVVDTNPRKILHEEKKIVIPGFASLREFSQANEHLLKQECGGAWQSYFQRGHWRMMFPFSRRNQQKEAIRLTERIRNNHAPVVHIVRFPSLDVNHAILLFDCSEDSGAIRFGVYDPNKPEAPTVLTFDKKNRTFSFPRNDYFIGGRVDVYEVYGSALK